MGLFGQSSPFDAEIEKATSENNVDDDWTLILDVCDKLTTHPRSSKDCLKSILRRLNHEDPHVVMQAITLLDACVNNCGKPFHLEVASRDFETEFCRLLTKMQPKVAQRMGQVFKNWADNVFKDDRELNLIPTLYAKLRAAHSFGAVSEKGAAKPSLPKDPNVVSSQQEEDDIAKAIELSLKETRNSPRTTSSLRNTTTTTTTSGAYPSLYPSVSNTRTEISTTANTTVSTAEGAPEPRKVRALYDFEAAEDNELTFFAGEIINVLEDTDAGWWKGSNERGEGLFPSNFVTADLSVDPERLDINQQHKSASKTDVKSESDSSNEAAKAVQAPQIDEGKIDRLMHLLQESNPEDSSQDSEEMLRLEREVNQMAPLIDAGLERVDLKHAQLTRVSAELVDAFNLYHSLMREDRNGVYSSHIGGPASGPPSYYVPAVGSGSMHDPAAYRAMHDPASYRMPGMPTHLPPGAPYYAPPHLSNNNAHGDHSYDQAYFKVPSVLNEQHQQQHLRHTGPPTSNAQPSPHSMIHMQRAHQQQVLPLQQPQPSQMHQPQALLSISQQQHHQQQQQQQQQMFGVQPMQTQAPYIQPTNPHLPANYNPSVHQQQQHQQQTQLPPAHMYAARPHPEFQQSNMQFAQVQQQMAGMSLAPNMNSLPAVRPNPMAGPQNNIPVYQQQR